MASNLKIGYVSRIKNKYLSGILAAKWSKKSIGTAGAKMRSVQLQHSLSDASTPGVRRRIAVA